MSKNINDENFKDSLREESLLSNIRSQSKSKGVTSNSITDSGIWSSASNSYSRNDSPRAVKNEITNNASVSKGGKSPKKFTFEECKEWIMNPFVNPKNGKKITKQSKVYSQLAKQCYSFDLRDLVWRKEPTSNKYPIEKDGKTHSCEKMYNLTKSIPDDDVKRFNYITRKFMLEAAQEMFPNSKEACFSSLLGDVFKQQYEKIGKGGYGTVYLVNPVCGDFPVVIKVARIFKRKEAENIIEKKYNAEIFILTFFRNLFKLKHIPNFPLLYAWNWCNVRNKEKISLTDIKYNRKTSIKVNLFMEAYHSTLSSVFSADWTTTKHLENILLQCFITLAIGQETAGLSHSDIKSSNFLVKGIRRGGYWSYEIKGKKYYVENIGLLVVMNDFGLSKFCKPEFAIIDEKYNFKNYGDRSIYIENGKIKQVKYKYFMTFDPEKGYKKVLDTTHSLKKWHEVNDLIDLEPINIDVDPSNLEKFPPREFLDDILDVARMFVGGPHSMGYMDHIPPPHEDFQRKKQLKEMIKYDSIYDLVNRRGRSYMFSAADFLNILFPDMKKPLYEELIEEFKIN